MMKKTKPATVAVSPVAMPEEIASWARMGTVRYARWDGGPIEAVKAVLSGWYYIMEPRAMESTLNWYSGSNSLELLLAANINWIWVTYSNGFSMQSERPTHDQLAEFIRRCHQYGIRVTAYMSMVNLFIDDMRKHVPQVDEWVQRNLQGRPIPYGAARYSGEPTRLLACLNHPEWRDYLRKRVEMALEIGVDAMQYDNQWTECRCERCGQAWSEFQQRCGASGAWPWPEAPEAETLSEAQRFRLLFVYDKFCLSQYEAIYRMVRETALPVNPHFLIYGNFNTEYHTFTLPANSAVSTEDLTEPGVVAGRVIHNFGRLRCLSGAGAGWRPVRAEYGRGRGMGEVAKYIDQAGVGATRFVTMTPQKHQLSMAEAYAHGVACQITPEGEFLRDLYFRVPEAVENWKAIAAYNRFFSVHEDLYADTVTASEIVSLHASGFRRKRRDDCSQRTALIGELARRGVVLDVLYDFDATDRKLEKYKVLLLADVWAMDDAMIGLAKSFSERGGTIVATGETGWYDGTFARRAENPVRRLSNVIWLEDPSSLFQFSQKAGRHPNIFDQSYEHPEEMLDPALVERLAMALHDTAPPPVSIKCPDCVLFHLTCDTKGSLLIHFLNYHDELRPAVEVSWTLPRTCKVEWFSPDSAYRESEPADASSIRIPHLLNYGVLRLQ